MPATPEPTAADFAEMRDEMMGNLDFVPADDELRAVWTDRLVGLAVAWGWGDTEVRELLAEALNSEHAKRRGGQS